MNTDPVLSAIARDMLEELGAETRAWVNSIPTSEHADWHRTSLQERREAIVTAALKRAQDEAYERAAKEIDCGCDPDAHCIIAICAREDAAAIRALKSGASDNAE